MSAQKPRAAYCTGCGTTFDKMHLLMLHRRLEHCGGRYLPQDKRDEVDQRRLAREYHERKMREGNHD